MSFLTKDRQQTIDTRIEEITLKTGLSYPDNDLLSITTALGLDVFEADMKDPEVNGIIQYKDGGDLYFRPRIYINKDAQQTRKRFTLAHELGHFILHPQEEKFRIDRFNYAIDSKESLEETEANYFAASLLVPKDRLLKVINITTDRQKIADYFGVSLPVIENRLKWIERN